MTANRRRRLYTHTVRNLSPVVLAVTFSYVDCLDRRAEQKAKGFGLEGTFRENELFRFRFGTMVEFGQLLPITTSYKFFSPGG